MNLQLEWEPVARVLRARDATETVAAEDTVHLDVRMLPVLDEATMRKILRDVLGEKGWTPQADGTLTKTIGTAVATLRPDGRTVVLRQSNEVTVKVTTTVQVQADTGEDKIDDMLDRRVQNELDAARAREQERLARENLARLAAAEPALRAEVQEALNRTYRRALEARARDLGDVESVQESGDARGTYEVRVVVKA